MSSMLALLGLIAAAWAVRSICLKQQSTSKKVGKSIFAGWYFLTAGGLGATDENKMVAAIVMLLIGAAFVWYTNRNYKVSNKYSEDDFRAHAAALKEVGLSSEKKDSNEYRSKNYAKGKVTSELTKIAFNYVNSSGESSFRDVDVKKFDGEYIEGYCHLSGKFKTFRLDRIEEDVIIRPTGEVIDPYDWATKMEAM